MQSIDQYSYQPLLPTYCSVRAVDPTKVEEGRTEVEVKDHSESGLHASIFKVDFCNEAAIDGAFKVPASWLEPKSLVVGRKTMMKSASNRASLDVDVFLAHEKT